MQRVVMHTDGASRGNPGPGGYGTILSFTDSKGVEHRREMSAGYALTTNNRMELMACIVGFEALTRPCSVELHSDSQYVINAFEKDWISGWIRRGWRGANKQPVANPDLWQRLLRAMEPHEVSFVWVKGHAGQDENERCDELATSAADGSELLVDEG
ncbi:MAG: ribonuclease HI, partial [Atopobiaceae bacterium]|nr:ribonuclease HI [Atopobiaceae bacterium]